MRLADMGEDLTIQHVFELVLRLKQICNFDPCHDGQQQDGAVGGRLGGGRGQRPESDRFQPMGADDQQDVGSDCGDSGRLNTTARFPRGSETE